MQTRLFLITFIFNCLQGWGQPGGSYIFRHLSQRDGLLHSSVYSISQDDDGYMWIGSTNGLQRYDGIRFTNFQKGITTLSSAAAPANIYTGDNGRVWFICGGVVMLDKKQNKFKVFNIDSLRFDKNFVFVEYQDEHGRPWYLGEYALYFPDSVSPKGYTAIPLVPNFPASTSNATMHNGRDETWIAAGQNVLLDVKNKRVYSADYNPIKHPLLRFLKESKIYQSLSFILPTRAGNYWLATWDGQLVFFEAATGCFKKYSVPAIAKMNGLNNIVNGTIIASCLFEDSHGTIWAGTNHAGLLCFDSTGQTFSAVTAKDVSGYGVDYNFSFYCITEDREGNLWLGTDKGINIFHPYRAFFKTISAQKGDKNALPGFEITSTLGLSNGDVLVTTWGGGFSVYDSMLQRKKTVQTPGVYPYTMTWDAVEGADGLVWIGAQQGFLYRYNSTTDKLDLSHPPEIMNSTIRCLTRDPDGNIYIGLHNGHVVKWDASANRFIRPVDSSRQAAVLSIVVQPGKIWAATESGLLLSDAGSMKDIDRFFPVTIDFPGGIKKLHGLTVLNDTMLIAGTKNAGLFFFNTKTKIFFREPALAAMEQQSVYAVKKAADGSIWFTTDYALIRYSPSTKMISRLKPEEGRINTAFSQYNFRPAANGQWLTSTENEVVSFDPQAVQSRQAEIPSVFVTGVRVLAEDLPVDSINDNHQINLESHQNFITFFFSDFRYDAVSDHVYYHRLSGVDKDWVQTGADGQANYTNLSPGSYVFEVKGDATNKSAPIQWFVSISAPFYATGWFRACLLLILSGSIFLAIRRRIAHIRHQSALKHRIAEAEISALRAQMNPHFIFNCLSAIDNMIETDQKEKATTYLNRFARLIRSVLESSKKNLVPLQSDMQTLNLYLELEQFRCDNRFTYTISAEPQILNGDYKVPPLVIQPYVENAIHHGILNMVEGQGKLEVSITGEGNRLVYRVKDNGVGRMVAGQLKHPAQNKQVSYGMAITEERIRMFNGNDVKNPVVITDLFIGDRAAGTMVEVFLKAD